MAIKEILKKLGDFLTKEYPKLVARKPVEAKLTPEQRHHYIYEFSNNPAQLMHSSEIDRIADKVVVNGIVVKDRYNRPNTINDATICDYLRNKGFPVDLNGEVPSFDEVMKDVKSFIEYKLKKRWHHISESLPPYNEFVIIKNVKGQVFKSRRIKCQHRGVDTNWEWAEGYIWSGNHKNITHWISLNDL